MRHVGLIDAIYGDTMCVCVCLHVCGGPKNAEISGKIIRWNDGAINIMLCRALSRCRVSALLLVVRNSCNSCFDRYLLVLLEIKLVVFSFYSIPLFSFFLSFFFFSIPHL